MCIRDSPDTILSDLAQRYINRKVFKSILFTEDKRKDLAILENLIKEVGFNPTYYTAIHQNFDLPYDIYRPELEKPRTQIEMIRKDGSLAELSQLSPLVAALAGTRYGDNRFYFPKEMLEVNGQMCIRDSYKRYRRIKDLPEFKAYKKKQLAHEFSQAMTILKL